MSEERRASLATATDPSPQNRAALDRARQGMDGLMARFGATSSRVADAMPASAKEAIGRFVATMPRVLAVRQLIDNGQASRLQVYDAYNQVADAMIVAADAIGQDSTDKETALQRSTASDLMRVSDWLDRSNSLAAAGYGGGGMTPAELAQYDSLTQAYRAELDAIAPRLPPQEQRKLEQLRSSPAWDRLSGVEDALVQHGFADPRARNAQVQELPVSVQEWQDAARSSATALSSMGLGDLGTSAAASEKQAADKAVTRSVATAAASILLAIIVLIVAVRMGNDLVRRLRRLRAGMLEADERLFGVVERIRRGEKIDVAMEVPELDYGPDEIGEVAAAFSTAQQAAVSAAVQEVQLREGANAVFLNIARRSQAVVQRQLQVLDRAERATDDPAQVALLFQLDHLSTRERRNAENLIILGGGQLGRQWRNSVPLIDVVRSAISETEQYKRVTVGRFPPVLVAGRAVADLVHLLAELIDNAIQFSPQGSRIDVHGNPVGRGVVVEVEDQGIGMGVHDRDSYNAMFRDPPDFGVMALTEDLRIGYFVVARLARKHDVRVSLTESSYGGVRAVVLIPISLTTFEGAGTEDRPDLFATAEFPLQMQVRSQVPDISPPAARPARADRPPVAQGLPLRTSLPMSAPMPPPEKATSEPTSRNRHWVELPSGDHVLRRPETEPAPMIAGTMRLRDERPPLPKRRRQTHLAPQLHREPEPAISDEFSDDSDTSARQAQSMMAAFQLGTRRGRAAADPSEP
nr:ATP-binding protein [Pseudonocardia acidicola]